MRPLVVLRPEPGLGETVHAARALGLPVVAAPLFALEPVSWEIPDPGTFDGVLLGSANAVRHAGPGLARLADLPVHAVGERTADAARQAGFAVATVGHGGLQALLDELEGPLHLLRLAGEDRVDLVSPSEVTIEDRPVYRARGLPLSAQAAHALRCGGVALVHSAMAARRLAAECERHSIDRGAVSIAALAPAIAAAAGPGWRAIRTAPVVEDAALLAMAADMCQERRRPSAAGQIETE